jgi:hypothetical protein
MEMPPLTSRRGRHPKVSNRQPAPVQASACCLFTAEQVRPAGCGLIKNLDPKVLCHENFCFEINNPVELGMSADFARLRESERFKLAGYAVK